MFSSNTAFGLLYESPDQTVGVCVSISVDVRFYLTLILAAVLLTVFLPLFFCVVCVFSRTGDLPTAPEQEVTEDSKHSESSQSSKSDQGSKSTARNEVCL